MRTRIIRALAAAGAAGVVLSTIGLTAGAAGASTTATRSSRAVAATRPVLATHSYGGYETSGRDFRYVQSLIRVPDMQENGLYPQTYIQLSNGTVASGDQYTRAGIETCIVAQKIDPGLDCTGVDWVAFIEAFNNSINQPYFTHFVPLSVSQGDGVFFSIYFDQAGNELHYVITPPGSPPAPLGFKTRAFGPLFDHAAGLADYTNSTGTPVPLPIFGHQFRLTQFLQGAVTTYSGNRGSWVGPWTTSEVVATSNGLPPPQGTVRLSPSYLFGDGAVANGAVRWGDAFGIWRRVG